MTEAAAQSKVGDRVPRRSVRSHGMQLSYL
jgi:hypothetical protein